MDDAVLVGGGEGERDLPAHVERPPEREGSPLLPGLEVFPLEPLHGDVGRALFDEVAGRGDGPGLELAKGDDADDVGVVELGEDLPLAEEAGLLGGLDALGRDDLERDVRARERVERPIDDADGPAPDLALDRESTADHILGKRSFHADRPPLDLPCRGAKPFPGG